ncbi:MAG: aminodeoxychorismate synthase component I [Fusobacterium sp.]|uniref:aminodeoxychorismate synthase component I n=1 Tax=Fusobacterium sp. TaxID=68766 RepID=UPI0026DCBDAA|nr:aminodeoxychorismate synthase component I [Fusobacterium sp.]MDO4690386.1 aminodeoxychorismate synthase component I [Fusobacterium sp.]
MMTRVKKLEKYVDIFLLFKNLYKKDSSIAFLDSSLHNKYGKYSIIALDLYLELKEDNEKFYVNGNESKNNLEGYLKKFLRENKEENPYDFPLIAGGILYFSYDYGRKFEKIKTRHFKDLDVAEAIIRFYRTFIIEDLDKKEIFISYQREEDLLELENFILNFKFEEENLEKNKELANYESNFKKEEYLEAISKMINYIVEGDIYITNMTQRLKVESRKNPLDVFSYLRKYNPSPFGAYLDYKDFQVISASPERFIKMEDKLIETRPIKGTRKRGRTIEEDKLLKNELLESEKDKSELLMIVDLERNDLHRICELQSVKVTELFEVETYSTVFHLVSTIIGKLKEDLDFVDLIKATFPGGSITGAPKIRAMEIIDELEKSRRNLYTGSLGYISFDGNCDLNIIIRTLVHKDGKYYLGVGGGITCESDLDFEYEETLQKAKALLEALV